ncbi:MAG: hypothetical protein DMD62_12325 [Gemmatimonadetes bacterium]|nr:MAG: hypothetical protein DMD62_12325 [Gemmatimonadota bacterium]
MRATTLLLALTILVGCERAERVAAPGELPSFGTQSATGKVAFVSARDGNNEIYVMNADGTGVTRLTSNAAADEAPTWSPDGSRIAFASDRDGNWEIYVMNADGSGITRLTNNPNRDLDPAWCGTRIAFMSDRSLPHFGDVYVMNDNGSNVTRVTTNNAAVDQEPAWSPLCDRIAFASDSTGDVEIYVVWPDGTGKVRLTNSAGYDEYPAWSHDGGRIAFTRAGDFTNREIYVMNADGSGATRLTNTACCIWDSDPTWSPDDAQIAFQSNRDGDHEIYVMNADGTGVTQLTQNTVDDIQAAWFAPASGGVVFESNWTTGTGATARSIMDSASVTPWDIWEDGSWGTLQGGAYIMEVVAGIAPPGYTHSLRVQQRGSCDNCWADVRKNPFIATGNTDYYFRFYFMTSDINGTWGDHGAEPWIWAAQYEDVVYLSKLEGPTGWGITMRIGGHGDTIGTYPDPRYPIGNWFLTTSQTGALPLAYNTWYRLEYWVHFTSANHMQVHPRIYDASGVLLFDDDDFVQEDPGASDCGGVGDWTLARWYTRIIASCNPGGDFEVNGQPDPDQAATTLQSLVMGNNGSASAQNTGLFWYYAGIKIRTDTWAGP